jgi:hypothetical protein
MTAPTIEDFDEVSRPRRNRPARPTERRTAIAESAGSRRHRSRERVA